MKQQSSLQTICLGALFLAMNIALSAVGIPVPGGHFYLNDIVICTAALLLGGSAACIAGSLGAFFGRPAFLSRTDVRFSRDARPAGVGDHNVHQKTSPPP